MASDHSFMDQAMAEGTRQYADVLSTLAAAGLPAVFTQTGGMNAALEVRLDNGQCLLITEADDSLAWERDRHRSWGVGLYPRDSEYDDGAIAWRESEDPSAAGLVATVSGLLREHPRRGFEPEL